VVEAVTGSFVPAKFHIKEQPQAFQRFKALWTPTQVILDPEGVERYRIEGFLPKEDFLARLRLGLGRLAFERQDYAGAERRFREVLERYPRSAAAAEAVYWAGVARYKRDNAPEALRQTHEELARRFPESEWAKRAAVWAG
jgi:tetratricopeptide (TPR) repeat protein